MKKVLVVSDIWACDKLTAGIALSKMIRSISRFSEVSNFVFIDRSLKNYTPITSNTFSNFYAYKPNENWTGNPYIKFLLDPFIDYFTLREVTRICKKLSLLIERNEPDHIILVLQGQTSYLLAKLIAESHIPYTTLTWDPWDWWRTSHNVGTNLNALVKESHSIVYRNGSHFVPSLKFATSNAIEESRSRVIYFPEKQLPKPLGKKLTNHRINIVFSGQNYASSEMSLFINSLKKNSWIFDGKELFLHILGSSVVAPEKHIIQHGWIDNETLPDYLSNFDIAFLPYPMSPDFLAVSEQSFPSKLSTYLSASLPVIYLGPKSASVATIASDILFQLIESNGDLVNLEPVLKEINANYFELTSKAHELNTDLFSIEAFDKKVFSWGEYVDLIPPSESTSSSILSVDQNSDFVLIGGKLQETIFIRWIQLIFSRLILSKMKSALVKVYRGLRALVLRLWFTTGKFLAFTYVAKFRIRNS